MRPRRAPNTTGISPAGCASTASMWQWRHWTCAQPRLSRGVPPQEAIAAALLHDICKIGKYRPGSDGKYHYTDNRALGHGSESVIMAQRFIQLTDAEQVAILWHMGLYGDPDKASTLSRAYTLYPLSMLLHFADMMATYCDER